jgi:cytochrome c553
VFRGFAHIIGLLAALAPAMAHAQQTNLDQGKSASQIFAGSCVECHKAARGLANGKNMSTLTEFLREHYTTSRDQAASLAAYVLGGRDTVAVPAPGKKQPERAKNEEEQKPTKRQRPGKPEEGAAANAKPPRRPTDEKPRDESNSGSVVNPIIRPEGQDRSTARNRRKEPKAPEAPQEPAAASGETPSIVAEPARREPPPSREPAAAPAPSAESSAPAAAAPSSESGEGAPVPRDNVPD